MDKAKKFELMNKIVRELEDLQNSQTALITKIGQIEVDNMNGLNDSLVLRQKPDKPGRLLAFLWGTGGPNYTIKHVQSKPYCNSSQVKPARRIACTIAGAVTLSVTTRRILSQSSRSTVQ